ncbi:MAG: carbohydrate ABC transporter substrate-binding protein, partial [Actinomycetota bacterium]|nr:carbohydrate ABC transporter substrate-binding protein [Actinomycetota bacterium]
MRTSRRTIAAAVAGAATIALIATGCSAGGGSGEGEETTTLTLATFNDFGYTDELLAQFTEETGIEVVHNKA